MELNKLEIQILIDIYDADMAAAKPINVNNYQLTEKTTPAINQELAFYLGKLKQLKFIKYDENKAFITGGSIHEKYKNNVLMIWGEEIHITEISMRIVEDSKKTAVQKIKEKGVDVAKGLAGALKNEFNELFAKTVSEYLKKIGQG